MTIIIHELKQGAKSFLIWTAAIAFLIVVCVFMYPQMKDEMDGVSEMFASMGSFSEAFGMDRLNFGTFIGFYAVECGNILGIGGAFFAALIAISALAKEQNEHTAEFLFTHPISRVKAVTEKLAAVVLQVVVMNLAVWLLCIVSTALIGEEIPWKELTQMHLAFLFLQLEISGICFGISAFVKRGSLGIGLGLSAMLYFLNLIANISESADFLKYITPFGYTDGADIVTNGSLDASLILLGMAYGVIGIVVAYLEYCKKDIQ